MIRIERPPNWDQILVAFPKADRRGVLFAYGEDIYNPSGVVIPRPILVHEYKHCAEQFQMGVTEWWDRYLIDDDFRYTEELVAHLEEYREQLKGVNDRNARARLSMRVAARLVAPFYNYQPPRTLKQAQRDLEALV